MVIQFKNGSQNVSWLVLSDDIVTELSTISQITKNKDIVDVGTTTTTLIEDYLPETFDAIDVFVDILNVEDANHSNATTINEAVP